APADVRPATAHPAAASVADASPRPAPVDSRLVTSVARQVLADQDRDAGLTDVDLIARDVLSTGPVDAGDAHRLPPGTPGRALSRLRAPGPTRRRALLRRPGGR
ncbi:hypothetical protein, partial [Dietzia lutea]